MPSAFQNELALVRSYEGMNGVEHARHMKHKSRVEKWMWIGQISRSPMHSFCCLFYNIE